MFVRYPSRPRPDHFSVHVLLVLVADVHLHAGDLLHGRVDGGELPAPAGVVEEGSVVKPVIIRAVHLGVVARGQCGHLVPVDGVIPGNIKLDLKGEILALIGKRYCVLKFTNRLKIHIWQVRLILFN